MNAEKRSNTQRSAMLEISGLSREIIRPLCQISKKTARYSHVFIPLGRVKTNQERVEIDN